MSDDITTIAARAHERDRYLAALLSPRHVRADLVALAAFAGELSRIPAFVKDPMAGRIRFQWWHDRLTDGTSGGHPIVEALLATINRHNLSRSAFTDIVEANEDAIENSPFSTEAQVFDFIDRTQGRLFATASQIVCGRNVDEPLCTATGRAYGIARLLVETPASLAHGRWLLPWSGDGPDAGPDTHSLPDQAACVSLLDLWGHKADMQLRAARPLFRNASRATRAAFLPLALVDPYLRVVRQPSGLPAGADINPLRRVSRLWWAHLRGTV
jgi:15-cis-phytoene synthase